MVSKSFGIKNSATGADAEVLMSAQTSFLNTVLLHEGMYQHETFLVSKYNRKDPLFWKSAICRVGAWGQPIERIQSTTRIMETTITNPTRTTDKRATTPTYM